MTGLAPLVTARLHLEPLQPATLEALLSRDTKAAERAQGTSLPDGFFAPTDDFFLEIQLGRRNIELPTVNAAGHMAETNANIHGKFS